MSRFLLFFLYLLAIPPSPANGEPLLTFVFAGQSNMVGKRCKAEELPAHLQKPNPKALFFDARSEGWIPLEPGKTQPLGFGPEIAFGARMTTLLGQPVGIIKHSKGGTNLARDWDPNSPHSLYAQLRNKVENARKARQIRIVGMIWVQGGADAKNQAMAENYTKNLRKLVEHARRDFGNEKMIFLSGRIPPKSAKTKPHWPAIRAAQQNLKMENYGWIECDDISVGPDKIHYDTAGMIQLGLRQAEMMADRFTPKPRSDL